MDPTLNGLQTLLPYGSSLIPIPLSCAHPGLHAPI